MKKLFFLLLFSAAIYAAPLFAENSEITFYVGGLMGDKFQVFAPVLFQNVDAKFDDKITGGFRMAYFFNDHFAAEGGIGFSPSTVITGASYSGGETQAGILLGIDTYVLHANLVALLANGPVVPYVTGGVGAIHFGIQSEQYYYGLPTPSETDFAWNAGGGVKIPFRKTVAFRFDGRVYFVNPQFSTGGSTTFTEITGGLSFRFDF
jgi:hypothetical protein